MIPANSPAGSHPVLSNWRLGHPGNPLGAASRGADHNRSTLLGGHMDKEMKERIEEAYREGYENGSEDMMRWETGRGHRGVNESWEDSWTKLELPYHPLKPVSIKKVNHEKT